MKVTVPGKTPMERLTEFTRRIIGVPKSEVDTARKNLERKKARRRRR